ncbi:hypothetical protein DCO46_18660 [Flavobacterium sp. HTF]|nr:hypothetical protein DCO46_18660 [Flavobacterium sp. HTF]
MTGRGGAGGGGGAYAHGTITVVAGTTINVKVGQAVIATAGSGGNGDSSYIESFESVFLAVGGNGGIANTTGTSLGGAGGSETVSKGNLGTLPGAVGGPGNNFLLNLGGNSGVGGKAGGASGGLGGASRTSALLGIGPGLPGVSPGGGGSGGLHLAGSAAQIGGDGARGEVRVTYTCPTYGIGTISALNACTSLGTSQVTFASTPTLLPIGVYTVTYNTSLPAATALTTTMTVTVAGTGNFNATGLTTPGTSNITVTNLKSGVCSTDIVSLNVAAITVSGPSVGGGVTGGTPVCSGQTSPLLTVGGHTGSVIKWQSSTDSFTTSTDIANTATTYTSLALTQTTQFRAVIQNGVCSSANSTPTTVTVNPLPQGSLTANGPFCATGAGQLTFTATAGTGPYTVVYKENGGVDRTASNVVSGTPFATFTTPVIASTTYTLVSVTGANTCIRSSGFTSGSATITVNPLPQGSLTANGPFCETGAGQLTFTATAGTGPYTVIYKENGGADRTASNVVSGTPFATFTTPVIASTTYTLVSVTGANSCIRNSGFTSGSATITVNPLPQGSLTANGPFCETGAGQLTFTATAGTGPYTVIYKENGGADRTASNVVSGTPFATFTTPVIASTIYTLVSVTGANSCIRSSGFTSGSATITVNPLPQGSLTANGPFCATGAGQLTFTATAGAGPYTVIYKENGGADRTASNVVSGTPFTAFTTPIIASTTYTLVSVTGVNSCIRSSGFTSGSATITVNPLPQGSLTANGPFCATGAGQLTFTATAGAGPYTVIYKENGGADRTASNVVSGTPFATFTTPVIASTTYTLVSVTGANTCIRSSGFTSGSATITVNPIPIPTFTTQPAASVCASTDVIYTTQAGQSNYIWSVQGVAGTDYTIISGGISSASNTVTLQWLTTGNKTVTVSYTSIGCVAGTNASNTTNVTKTIRGVVNGGTHVCSGDASPLLTLNGYNGTILRWEYAEAIPYVWQTINHTANTYQPGILTTSTSYRAVVKDGTCAEDYAIETRIDIDTKPSIPVVGIITQPTCITPTGSVTLSGLPASPNWTITQNGTTTYTATGTNYTIPNLAPGNYTFTIHDVSSCPSLPTINIEIKSPDTNTWNGISWSKGSPPIITDIIHFSADYITAGDLSGCSCIVDSGATVTVSANNTLTISNPVTNNGGNLIFENNSSLVQTNSNPAINSGNITYKRTSKQILRGDYVYWSTPVNPQKLIDVSPGTLYNKYLDFNGDYWGEVDRNTNMMVGKGYIIRGPQNYSVTARADYTASFTGVPNNGNISGQTVQSGKYYLIGNPYPSALDADKLLAANLFLSGTIFFWTHNTPVSLEGAYQYKADDYATYNTLGGVGVSAKSDPGHTDNPATDAGVKPTGKIAAGQSFFAKALNNGTVAFTNDMRLGGASNTQFFKTTNTSKKADDLERHRVWLNMSNVKGAFKQLLVGYIEGATDGHDNAYDGDSKDANPYLDFYSILGNRKYVIQGRALPFSETDLVPLGYRSAIVSDFTISIDQVDGNLMNHDIYIEDKVTGLTHNLKTSAYTFSSVIGVFNDRFILRYTNNTLGTDTFNPTDKEVLITVKNKIITINAFDNVIDEILVFDISGKEIYKKNNLNDEAFEIENLKSQNQVLLVKVRLKNNNVTTQKIVF